MTVAIALGATAGAGAVVWWILRRRRITPAERERRRRAAVHLSGRMIDGVIVDLHDELIHYTYSVAGVTYANSQLVTDLRAHLPQDPALLIGPVTVKYLARNPADSIILCEGWSGIRRSCAGVRESPDSTNSSEEAQA